MIDVVDLDRESGPGHSAAPVLEYVGQAPGDLVYRLLSCPAPRDSVKVLIECRVAFGSTVASIAIIGSSHFLEVDNGGRVFTEMLASTGGTSGALPPLKLLRGCPGSHELEVNGLSYRFQMDSRRYGRTEFERESDRLSGDADGRIWYRFPARIGESAAVTCLDWRASSSGLTLETYHTFPGESTVVRSRTRIGLPERRVTT